MGQCSSAEPLRRDPSLRICSRMSFVRHDTINTINSTSSTPTLNFSGVKEHLSRAESCSSVQHSTYDISDCSASTCSLSSGMVLGDRYRLFLKDVIGEGEFGTVYSCTDIDQSAGREYTCCESVKLLPLRTNGAMSFPKVTPCSSPRLPKGTSRMLAAKIILKEKMTDACFEKLNNEIRIGLLCRHHTHLCHVVDVLETNDSVIIIMRRVLHGNLIEHVHDRRLETGSDTLCEAEVKKLAQQLVEAVYELHSMGIAHRDIKLDNILVSCDGEVTLTDFGHAVMAPSTASNSGSPVLTMNDAIDIAGTHAYGSPQLRRGSNYNAFSADIWCVGIVLHVLLTGFFPFPDELPSEQMTTWYRPPSTASPECQKLLSTILTSEEASRPSARELRKMKWLTRNA